MLPIKEFSQPRVIGYACTYVNGDFSIAQGLDNDCVVGHILDSCITIDACETDDFDVRFF